MRLSSRAKSIRAIGAVFALAGLLLVPQSAAAASCASLKSELRRLTSPAKTVSPAAQKWRSAQKQQQKALAAANRDARYFSCSSEKTDKCRQLQRKIKRMSANLAAIERQLAKAGGGASAKDTRRARQIRAALKRQNCDAPPAPRQASAQRQEARPESGPSFLARLFRSGTQAKTAAATPGDREISQSRPQRKTLSTRRTLPSGGTFRTLCVRTCDGYFFPVSFSTGRRQFANDEARCSEICPASPTELYVYRNPGGDQSEMMSLAGIAYADQPFAFRYKSEFVKDCSCRKTGGRKRRSAWSVISAPSGDRVSFADISAGLPRASLPPGQGVTFPDGPSAPSSLSRLPLTKAQLPPYEDPDTLTNLEKGFDVTKLTALEAASSGAVGTVASPPEGGDFPLLSLRRNTEDVPVETDVTTPVFTSGSAGTGRTRAPAGTVRVVGPEYYVAQ